MVVKQPILTYSADWILVQFWGFGPTGGQTRLYKLKEYLVHFKFLIFFFAKFVEKVDLSFLFFADFDSWLTTSTL